MSQYQELRSTAQAFTGTDLHNLLDRCRDSAA